MFRNRRFTIGPKDTSIRNSLRLLSLKNTIYVRDIKNEFLYEILKWDLEWFYDKQYNKQLPSVINDVKMYPVKQTYDSIEEYQNVMFSMLVHEFWYSLKQDFQEFIKNKTKKKITATIMQKTPNDIIINNNNDQKIYFIKVKAIMSCHNRNYPRSGDLVKLKSVSPGKNSAVFAYVDDFSENYHMNKKIVIYKLITNESIKNLVGFNVTSDKTKFLLTTVTFILGYLSLIDTLKCLPNFSLKEQILSPNANLYTMSEATDVDSSHIVTKQSLNAVQLNVISRLLKVIDTYQPKICLVQGPPGTGKSKTIVNLVASILKRNRRLQILVCAPSNKAIDSVVLRLLEVESILSAQDISLRIVRVGDEDKMDDSVKKISLANQALNEQRQQFKREGRYHYRKPLYQIKQDILATANVITSTLASCYTSNLMTSIFGLESIESRRLQVCIVDEAAQATELLTLVPLLLGVQQLILVGDPQQLRPTVLSQKAIDHGYDLSLFARAQKVFEDEKINPIVMLDTQYRMVKAISQWPNSYYYQGSLKDSATVNSLGICNYKLFNHTFPQDEEGFANEKEAELVVKLIKLLQEGFNINASKDQIEIGVITPYNKQRKLICEMLYPNQNKTAKKKTIKIASKADKIKQVSEKFIEESENNTGDEDTDDTDDSSCSIPFLNPKLNINQDLKKNSNDEEPKLNKTRLNCLSDSEAKENSDEDESELKIEPSITSEEEFKSELQENLEKKSNEDEKMIEINTVDSFQGSERDIIIMSCVKSLGLGFTKDRNRLCVSLTRAKHSLIMFGNFNAFNCDEMWSSLIHDAADRNSFINIDDSTAESVFKEHVFLDNIIETLPTV